MVKPKSPGEVMALYDLSHDLSHDLRKSLSSHGVMT
jgi:hypothetical protein